jgi:hypothetical protein
MAKTNAKKVADGKVMEKRRSGRPPGGKSQRPLILKGKEIRKQPIRNLPVSRNQNPGPSRVQEKIDKRKRQPPTQVVVVAPNPNGNVEVKRGRGRPAKPKNSTPQGATTPATGDRDMSSIAGPSGASSFTSKSPRKMKPYKTVVGPSRKYIEEENKKEKQKVAKFNYCKQNFLAHFLADLLVKKYVKDNLPEEGNRGILRGG